MDTSASIRIEAVILPALNIWSTHALRWSFFCQYLHAAAPAYTLYTNPVRRTRSHIINVGLLGSSCARVQPLPQRTARNRPCRRERAPYIVHTPTARRHQPRTSSQVLGARQRNCNIYLTTRSLARARAILSYFYEYACAHAYAWGAAAAAAAAPSVDHHRMLTRKIHTALACVCVRARKNMPATNFGCARVPAPSASRPTVRSDCAYLHSLMDNFNGIARVRAWRARFIAHAHDRNWQIAAPPAPACT